MGADVFAAHRALARALAKLAPFIRQQAIEDAARALADGRSRTLSELRPILSDRDFARACAKAVQIRHARDATAFDRAVTRSKARVAQLIERFLSSIAIINRRRNAGVRTNK
jgi:hypothetical protein